MAGEAEDRRIRENYNNILGQYYTGQLSIGETRNKIAEMKNLVDAMKAKADTARDAILSAKYSAELRKLNAAEKIAERVMEAGISDPSQLNAAARYYLEIPFKEGDTEVLQGMMPGTDIPFTRAVPTRELVKGPAIGMTKPAQTQINMPPGQKAKETKLGQREAEYESGTIYDEVVKEITEQLKGTPAFVASQGKIPKDLIADRMVRKYRNSGIEKYKDARAFISPDGQHIKIVDSKGEVLYSD